MDSLYNWIVFLHVAGAFTFVLAHGASAGVALKLREERDVPRVQALLELSNVANLPIAIYPGMKIGQISFIRMTSPAERPYGSTETRSKYQGQRGPTPSRYYLNFEDEA